LIPNDTEAYQPPYFVFPRQEGMPIYTMEDLIRGILAQQNGRLECYPNMDLGWVISGKVCCLTEYTVKQGTSLLRRQQHAQQFVKILEWYDFITPLSVRLDYDPLHCLEDVSRILRPIRQLPIPSIYKLPFWETLNNAQVNAELIHKDQPCICGCSNSQPGRTHFYTLECPIAYALYRSLSSHLLPCDVSKLLLAIWYNTPAFVEHSFSTPAWSLISVLAVYAIDITRREAYHRSRRGLVSVESCSQKVIQIFTLALDSYADCLPPGQPIHQDLPFFYWNTQQNRWMRRDPG
jgi:hypothetical protein